jgi:hypothetical protein
LCYFDDISHIIVHEIITIYYIFSTENAFDLVLVKLVKLQGGLFRKFPIFFPGDLQKAVEAFIGILICQKVLIIHNPTYPQTALSTNNHSN